MTKHYLTQLKFLLLSTEECFVDTRCGSHNSCLPEGKEKGRGVAQANGSGALQLASVENFSNFPSLFLNI